MTYKMSRKDCIGTIVATNFNASETNVELAVKIVGTLVDNIRTSMMFDANDSYRAIAMMLTAERRDADLCR